MNRNFIAPPLFKAFLQEAPVPPDPVVETPSRRWLGEVVSGSLGHYYSPLRRQDPMRAKEVFGYGLKESINQNFEENLKS